jgi:hypothetical protein
MSPILDVSYCIDKDTTDFEWRFNPVLRIVGSTLSERSLVNIEAFIGGKIESFYPSDFSVFIINFHKIMYINFYFFL